MLKKLVFALLPAVLFIALAAVPEGQPKLLQQSAEEAQRKSQGCISSGCHVNIEPMHASPAVRLGCTDCHGGNAESTDKKRPTSSHGTHACGPRPRTRSVLRRAEQGDARVHPLRESGRPARGPSGCGISGCPSDVVYKVQHGLMNHGAFLWEPYSTTTGPSVEDAVSVKVRFEEASPRGSTVPPRARTRHELKGVIPVSAPARLRNTQPGNTLRVFERGEERLSPRGFGTLTRTTRSSGMQKTRLFDPLLSFMGTNNRPATPAWVAPAVTWSTLTTATRSIPTLRAQGTHGS
jgi:hypothetical protein